MTQVIHHMGLTVGDLDRSVAFYTRYFALSEVRRNHVEGEMFAAAVGVSGAVADVAFLAGENAVLELVEYRSDESPAYPLGNADIGAAHPCFSVEDLDGLYARMRSDGVPFFAEPQVLGWETKMAYCRDPDGISVELVQFGSDLSLSTLLRQANRTDSGQPT